MKLFKRNAIIITVVLFVCVAVYLNWSYNKNNGSANTDDLSVSTEEGSLFYEDGAELAGADDSGDVQLSEQVSDYFATARLTRQQARDSAINTLKEATEVEAASQESKDSALGNIAVMASYSLAEAEIETLIRAKGFSECVVFLKDDSIIVTVPAPQEGLSASAVSRITDIVLSETELGMDQIKVIEVK